MSAVQDTTTSAPVTTTEHPTTVAQPDTFTTPTETKVEDTPAAAVAEPATTEEKKDETAPVAEDKPVEPISEGTLGYKGPGLISKFTFSKKDFWLSDDAITPQHLDLFMRGEKPEVAYPIVAWAGQTGKGLLFFNKKDETDKTHPHSIIPLYEATDLKKASPHEFSLRAAGHSHTFKATSDAERDGWYMSIEKSVELGKAQKESVRESEGYKEEMKKLNTPNTRAAGVAGAARSQSRPKKSTEVDRSERTKRTGSSDGEDVEKKAKSRSTSRGMLERFKAKKDETTAKKEEKKEEQKSEDSKDSEPSPVVAAPVAAIPAASEPVKTESPAEEKKEAETAPSKRGSIFGRLQSSFKSPTKEKTQNDAELKPETPAKEDGVSENPPQLPETTVTEPVNAALAAEVIEPAPESKPEEKKVDTVSTPNKEKSNFLSGIGGFINKRRSVSPSTAMKDAPKTESPVEAPKETTTEAPKPEEPIVAAPEHAVVSPAIADKPTETPAAEEPTSTTADPAASTEKRGSILTSLGRRASKAFKIGGSGSPAAKKENVAPTTAAAENKDTIAGASEDKMVNGTTETKPDEPVTQIGDVVPEAVTTPGAHQASPTVTASA